LTPRTSLESSEISSVISQLSEANKKFMRRYPGESDRRQAVHTVYGGAHLFKADSPRRLGEVALRSLDDKPRYYVDGDEVNRASFRHDDARFALQRGFKRSWAFESALRIGSVQTYSEAGLDFPVGTDAVRTLEVGGVLDALDDRQVPSRRVRIEARSEWNLESLGATHAYWRTELRLRGAIPVGKRDRVTIQLDGFAGLSGNDLPVYEEFRIGGPILLPGYHIEELWGPQALAASMSLRYRVIKRLQIVARAGAGNVWATRQDISLDSVEYGFGLGLYYPTRIGPVTANVGVRRGGGVLATFTIGYP
jgi:outer membrane protein assembly factor BamA